MKKMSMLGSELDQAALQHVHGGGFVVAGPGDTGFHLTPKQQEAIVNGIIAAGKAVYQVGKKVWNTISGWF
jgi:hypothetical protein